MGDWPNCTVNREGLNAIGKRITTIFFQKNEGFEG